MCRYAQSGPYKSHFACFACRKAFKQPSISEWLAVRGRGFAYDELSMLWSRPRKLEAREQELGVRLSDLEAEYRTLAGRCPACDAPMIDMGLDFKPPRHADKRAWQILQGMFCVGHAFQTCGCDGPGFVPQSSAEYRLYLDDRRAQFVKQLARVRQSAELSSAAKREAGQYWMEKISKVDAERAKLS